MTDSAHGTTRIAVMTGVDGRTRLDLRAGLLVPRAISRVGTEAEVALVGGGALLLGGDRVDVEIVVGDGCRLDLVDIGGTVAYDGEGRPAAWNATIALGADAHLTWAGLPFVVSTGADVIRRTTAAIGDGATLQLRETLVLGRDGEVGGRIVSVTTVVASEGPVFVEDIELVGAHPVPGVAAGYRVLDTVLLAGRRAPAATPAEALRLDLEGRGTLGRWLGTESHRSPIDRVWDAWSRPGR